jgi:putative salt-induced outer membrane protein YdiY
MWMYLLCMSVPRRVQNTQTNLNVFPWLINAHYRAQGSWQRRVGAVTTHYAYSSTDNAHFSRRILVFYTQENAHIAVQCEIFGHCPWARTLR